MFFKIGVLKNLANFTGKHLRWSLLLTKFLKNFIKDTPTQVFSCEIYKNFKNTFSTEYFQWMLLSKETPTQVLTCEICEIFEKITFFYRTPPIAPSEWTLLSSKITCNRNRHDFFFISCVIWRCFRFPYSSFPRNSRGEKARSFSL